MGFANRTEPADENSWNFRNKLDPSAQHFQINRSYSISGGKRFYVGKDKNPLSFFLTAGHTMDYQYTDEIIRNTTTSGTVYKDMNGKKYAENISQLALANVDFDMQNRHHISYCLRSNFFYQLCTSVLVSICQFDFFCYCHTVFCDVRSTEFLLNDNVTTFRAQRYFYCILLFA